MAPLARIRLQPGTLPMVVGSVIRDTRQQIGWSQEELALRARTSQAQVCRIEHAASGASDLETLDRVLSALGLRSTLEVEGRHLADPTAQFDGQRSLVVTDLAPHRGLAMTPSALQRRRTTPTYRDYADAASVLRRRRR